jgi:hypothetical protein
MGQYQKGDCICCKQLAHLADLHPFPLCSVNVKYKLNEFD